MHHATVLGGTLFNTDSSAAPQIPLCMSEDAGIEPSTVATSALIVALTIWLDLIHVFNFTIYMELTAESTPTNVQLLASKHCS
jgi:hypothetical protein